MPMYDDLGNKFLSLPEQVNKNKKDIKVIQDAGIAVEPAGEHGDIQFNEDDALGASSELHWDMVNERLGVGTNEPAEKLHVAGTIKTQALDVNGNGVVSGDLTVGGNLTISGTTTTLDTETLQVEDNIILINKGQTGTPSPLLKSGIEVERGDEDNYFFYFDESDDTFKIGKTTLQPVATREDAPTNEAVPHWNSTTNQFETTGGLYKDAATGRVGIGTASPSRTLDIQGSIQIGTDGTNSLIDMPSNSWGDKWYFAGSGIKMSMDVSSTSWLTTYGGSTGLTKFRWSSTKTGGPGALGEGPILDLLTEGTALFYGDVGIGTTSPTEKLHVAGKVKATEFVGDLVGDVTGNADTATEAIRAFSYQDDADVDRLISFVASGSPDSYRASYRDQDGSLKYNPYTKVLTVPTVVADVTGDVTGNLTGDVTGDVEGDVTGTASGNLPIDADIQDLDNVEITSPSDGQVLTYDIATYKWKNADATGGGSSGTTITLLATATDPDTSFVSVNVSDVGDYDDMLVEVVTRYGAGTAGSPYYYGITTNLSDITYHWYYNDIDNGYSQAGAAFLFPKWHNSSISTNIKVYPKVSARTSYYVKCTGAADYVKTVKLYGIIY